MTKNTKANLTLIFYISKRNVMLKTALEAIKKQKDKNFNLIFVLAGVSSIDKEIFSKFDFSAISDVQHIILSESLGDSYAFNYCLPRLKTKFAYCFDSNVILHDNFVSTINSFIAKHSDADVISVYGVPNIYIKKEYVQVKTMADDFCIRPLMFFDNKILNVEYIKKNNITQPAFKHYPVYFYILLFKAKPKWYSIGKQICSGSVKKTYQFNTMDLYEQCNEIVKLLDEKPFNEHKDEIEYMVIIALLRNFLYTFFEINKGRFLTLRRILIKVNDFLKENFPKWQKNKWLTSKENLNTKEYLDYLINFKPRLFHAIKALNSEAFRIKNNNGKKN